MNRWLICFSGADYNDTTEALTKAIGPTEVYVYDDVWLMEQPFTQLPGNKWLWEFEPKRCFGYCSWKPFIILHAWEALKRRNEDGVILYIDADCKPLGDLTPLFDIAERDGAWFACAYGCKHDEWCKRECFEVMAQSVPSHDVDAGCARYLAIRATLGMESWRERQFLYEWLTYCVNRKANTKETVPPTYSPHFIEHRDEQAIMTNLILKYGYRFWRPADQDGKPSQDDRDVYGELFEQSWRSLGNNGKGSRFRRIP